ncbi:MAG: IS66 family transposase [Acetobacteraceae bacterium]
MTFHATQPPPAKAGPRRQPPRQVGHHLLLRPGGRNPDALRSLTDPRVPVTNSLAEQDARMMKLRQKISGSFRCDDGAKNFAVVRPMLSTARKQGWHIHQTLTRDPEPDRGPPGRVTATA